MGVQVHVYKCIGVQTYRCTRRVSRGGGPRGLAPPPLEIEKQKKKKKVIRSNISSIFATFLVENTIFSAIF